MTVEVLTGASLAPGGGRGLKPLWNGLAGTNQSGVLTNRFAGSWFLVPRLFLLVVPAVCWACSQKRTWSYFCGPSAILEPFSAENGSGAGSCRCVCEHLADASGNGVACSYMGGVVGLSGVT